MKKSAVLDNLKQKNTKEIKTFLPKKACDTEEIISYMKTAPVIVTLTDSNLNHVQRIIDILLGAAVAFEMKICPLDKENYLFTKN